jgi:hypothetical protein
MKAPVFAEAPQAGPLDPHNHISEHQYDSFTVWEHK